ncbi:MAG: hypothetical protein M3N82_18005 [Pseudomonadota bacterium]|nr:hypothetical protein [Pseudomonadota bacterium]
MWLLIALALILLITIAPVMIAARIVGAGRTGFWICLLALFVSLIIVGVAVRMFHGGGLLAFFVAPLGFMLILDTTYLRGLGIVVLQYLIAALIAVILAFTAIGSMFHMKDMMRDLPIDSAPSQSV